MRRHTPPARLKTASPPNTARLLSPTLVILDMDGTLVQHTNQRLLNWLEALGTLAQQVRQLGRALSPARDAHLRISSRRPGLFGHRLLHRLRRRDVSRIVQPSKGVVALLALLRQRGIPTLLVSNGLGRGYGRDILRAFALEHLFDVILFREDVRRAKPNPDALLKALSEIGRPLHATDVIWAIGDQYKDIAAARAAASSLPCIMQAIHYSSAPTQARIDHHSPDAQIGSWDELEAVVRSAS